MKTHLPLVLAAIGFATSAFASTSNYAEPAPCAKSEITLGMPVNVTASDFVTKVFGIFSPQCGIKDLEEDSSRLLHITPTVEDAGLWLDDIDGYAINYYGMHPATSVYADVDASGVKSYSYFFMFPYDNGSRNMADMRQMDFCSVLLQEMTDIGASMGLNTLSQDTFDVYGEFKGNLVEITLREEASSEGGGRFIVTLSVEPEAFEAADYAIAY